MKKYIPVAILFILIGSLPANAQLKGFAFGGYLEAGSPTAGFEETNGNGVGVGVAAELKLPAKLGLTGSLGVMHFSGKRVYANNGSTKTDPINAFPLRLGLKYKLPLVYVKLESGVAKLNDGSGSAVIVSPGIGIRILGFDLQGKFEAWTKKETQSFWGLRAAIFL
jgi:hypothetical protein